MSFLVEIKERYHISNKYCYAKLKSVLTLHTLRMPDSYINSYQYWIIGYLILYLKNGRWGYLKCLEIRKWQQSQSSALQCDGNWRWEHRSAYLGSLKNEDSTLLFLKHENSLREGKSFLKVPVSVTYWRHTLTKANVKSEDSGPGQFKLRIL